jgi:hypothetical protein
MFLAILSPFAWVFPAPAANPPAEDWAAFDPPGKFITALCATDEALWIGTEDRGLWRLDLKADPAAQDSWRQFTAKDTGTDHVYAVAVDTLGRVWAGTVNQGVSVYNGKDWRNYGVLDGCSGERVFAIAADPDPKRGNVWIGTDHGLTCWTPAPTAPLSGDPYNTERGGYGDPPRPDAASSAPGTWRTYTQAAGLPSQQIYAVAVAPSGRVWVGTECDGLAWADPPYDKWHPVRAAAEKSGDEGEAPGVGAKGGPGLPSNLVNDLLVLANGTVVVSTDYGLGIGRSGGSWASWQGLSKEPYENYSRGLAEDRAGGLWIATRQKGLARLDMGTGELTRHEALPPPKTEKGKTPTPRAKSALPDNYVFAVASTSNGDIWAGTYGGGLARLKGAVPAAAIATVASPFQAPQDREKAISALAGAMSSRINKPRDGPASASDTSAPSTSVPRPISPDRALAKSATATPPPLPQPSAPPTLADLNAMLAALAKVPFVPPEKQPVVVRLDDDWLTKGDCLGRYGRYWGCWCAICSPQNYIWGAGPEPVDYFARIGPNCNKGDGLRYWVHWLHTKNVNTLEMPPTYCHSRVVKGYMTADFTRRQAEWDDHSEAYPMSKDGPHLYCTLRVPQGLYYLSLYNFNKDGHTTTARWRDYGVSIRQHPAGRDSFAIEDFRLRPELA